MHPVCIVLLRGSDGGVRAYELFFSVRKARRAFQKAKVKDESGHHELCGEAGSWGLYQADRAEFDYFGEYISTKRNPFRKSFLNLSGDEELELSERFNLPVDIIRHISQMEQDIVERKRYFGHNHNAATTALMRKYLPSSLYNIMKKI